MVKRRASTSTVRSDDETERSFTPRKRARHESSDAQAHGSLMASTSRDESVLPWVLDTSIGEEAELQFEARHASRVRQAMARKKIRKGKAQSGIIKSITVKNFMCHDNATLDFGPQINFVTGRNGSGKSAFLSALQIGLGARTHLTGRGANLTNFISTGSSRAEVLIKMKNEGLDAFRHDLYGDVITICRKFSSSGETAWSMSGADGRVFGRTKRELTEMVETMGLQIDSPLTVLTQEVAKQFLANSSASDKYTFFLKGTGLLQLLDNYCFIAENIKRTTSILKQKRLALPDLKQAHEAALFLREEASKADSQRERLEDLARELAWCRVADKGKELAKIQTEHEVRLKKVEKVTQRLATAEERVTRAKDDLAAFEENPKDTTQIDELQVELQGERQRFREQLRKIKDEVRELEDSEREMNATIVNLRSTMNEAQKRIDTENERLRGDYQGERDNNSRQIFILQDELDRTGVKLTSMRDERDQKQAYIKQLEGDAESARKAVRGLEGDVTSQLQHVEGLQASLQNKYAVYGRNTMAVLNEIGKQRWTGAVPVGPLGLHVSLLDARYRRVMQIQLGNLMSSFVVANVRDRNVLRGILKAHNHYADIITSEPDIFDYSEGVPRDPSVTTPLHVLQISDEWVKRVLINYLQIERTGLALSRSLADEVARKNRGMPVWSADCFRVLFYREGGASANPMSQMRENDRRQNTFVGENLEQAIGEATERAKELRLQTQSAREQAGAIQRQLAQERQALKELNLEGKALSTALSELKVKLEEFKESVKEVQPTKVRALEEHKASAEAEIQSVIDQFAVAHERKQGLNRDAMQLSERSILLAKEIATIEADRKSYQAKFERLAEGCTEAEEDQEAWLDRLASYQKKLDEVLKSLNVAQKQHDELRIAALGYGAELGGPRAEGRITADIQALEKAVRERDRRRDKSLDELDIEVERARARCEEVELNLSELKTFNKALQYSLDARMFKWNRFKLSMALRLKMQFQYYLSQRGFGGNVTFDHSNKLLHIRVQTEEEKALQRPLDGDLKSLSGGERSFAQICLLLSLWDSIGSPIRCLDEFDVFMDSVNRRISVKMMIEAALLASEKQYMFISPQEIGNHVVPSKAVKLVELCDPGRGQQTLDFSH